MNNNVYTFQAPRLVAQSHLEKLGDLSSKLPVYSKTPVLYKTEEHDYVNAPGRHLILNTRNNQVINVVKDKFNLDYQPIHGVNIIEEMLIDSGLDLTDISREYSEAYDGGRYVVNYTLPAHEIDLGGGDVSVLRLCHRNSFDGSWCFTLEVGYLRMVCTNGQVSIDHFTLFKTKHTPKMSPHHGARKIAAVLNGFEKERERWTAWKEQSITDMEAFRIFAKAAKFQIDDQMSLYELLSSKNYKLSKAMNYMWSQYTKHEQKVLGSNEWAAYNAMTHWATHAPASTKNTAKNIVSIQVDRGEQVRNACKLLKVA